MDLKTSFKILSLSSEADATQVKHAYKAQVRRWHPDQFPEGSTTKLKAEEQLKQINIAYTRVKAHQALYRQEPAIARHGTTAAPKEKESTTSGPPGKKQKTRTWIDHLFNTLSAIGRSGAVASSTRAEKESRASRTTTFGQVLDEMAGGSIPPRPKGRQGNTTTGPRRSATRGRRYRRSDGTLGAVGGTEDPGPIKPVGRVRGIGRSR